MENIKRFFILSAVFCAATALAYDWSTNPGTGTPENPYQISEPTHLIAIDANPDLLSKCFILIDDIVFDPDNNPEHVFESALIAPDQDDARFYQGTPFSGVFDGRNHHIVNLTIQPSGDYKAFIGIFGGVGSQAVISNLHVQNFRIQNCAVAGAIAGDNDGMIEKCTSQGHIQGVVSTSAYGGLVGSNDGVLRNCFSNITMSGVERSAQYGGLAGGNSGLIEGCHVQVDMEFAYTGNINAGGQDIGGLVGFNLGEINNSTALIYFYNLNVSGLQNIGGLAGQNQSLNSNIMNCHAELHCSSPSLKIGGLIGQTGGEIYHQGQWRICRGKIINSSADLYLEGGASAGGLVGTNLSTDVDSCFSSISVTNVYSNTYGGLIGSQTNYFTNDITVQNCYATGTIAPASWKGGLFGYIEGTHVIHCYSTCFVGSAGLSSGGLVGYVGMNNPDIVSCYFLESAGPDNGFGTPLDDPNMMIQDNFVDWDFVDNGTDGANNIWRMCVDGVDYPRLSWEFARGGDFACGDGVDMADLESLADQWLTTAAGTPAAFNHAADANSDKRIDLTDLAVLSENWP